MDKKYIQSVLQNALEEKIPSSEINLWIVVKTNLAARQRQQEKINTAKPRRLLPIAWITVMTIALLAFTFFTPQGRAWAQEIARFFTKVNSTTIQLSAGQSRSINELLNEVNTQYDLPLVPVYIPPVAPEMARIAGCETSQKSQSYRCQVALAESKLGFDLKEFAEKPIDWEFKSLTFNKASQYAVMSYDLDIRHISGISSSQLVFVQGRGDFANFDWYKNNPWEAVPSDKAETVSIGNYQGEYVIGRFGLKPGTAILTWSEETREQRLVWSEGERWYLIDFSPNLNVVRTMDKDELIRLAESLVAFPIPTTEPLDPAYLTSISDAEKISGLDLKAPTLLPMNVNFSYARYSSIEKKVHLIYGDNEELTIDEWKGKPIEYKKPLGNYEFTCEITNINRDEAFYCFREGPSPRSFLWWHKDGLNYQMFYNVLTGAKIGKEEMLLIAQSMGDIDDLLKNSGRSYEEIILYEKALGLHAKKFSETPAGWMFTNFWGDAYVKCLSLIYTATTGQGTLFINECKTDKRLDTSIFPSDAMREVKVGNTKGQYIAGSFMMTQGGKQVWDPAASQKQLYWQQDGLWIQMILYGESATRSNEKALIAYAESLK